MTRAQYDQARANGWSDDDLRAEGYEIPAIGADAPPPAATSGKGWRALAPLAAAGPLAPVVAAGTYGAKNWRKSPQLLSRFLNAATFGLPDAMRAATLPTGLGYKKNREIIRAQSDAGLSTAQKGVADLAGMALTAIGTSGMSLLPRLAAKAGAPLSRGRQLADAGITALENALLAGGTGAVTSATGGGSMSDIQADALKAAAAGAAAGTVIPGAGMLLEFVRRGAGTVSKRAAPAAAQRVLLDAAKEEGLTLPALRQRIATADPDKPLTLIEHLGEPGRQAARGARGVTGHAAKQFTRLETTRQPDAGRRVMADVRDALGIHDKTTAQMVRELDESRAAIGAAEFLPDRMAAPVSSPAVRAMITQPVFRDAYRVMTRAQQRFQRPEQKVMPHLYTKDGALAREPTVRDIEEIRKGLSDILRSGYRTATKRGGERVRYATDAERRVVRDAKQALLDDPDLNAEHAWYRSARQRLKDEHDAAEALVAGERLTGSRVEDVADVLAESPSPDMVRQGFANKLASDVLNTRGVNASTLAGGGGQTPEKLRRLEALSATPAAGQRLAEKLAAEDAIARTSRALGQQSATADIATERLKLLGTAVQAGLGNQFGAARDIARAIISGNLGKTANEIADIMTTLDRGQQLAVVRALESAAAESAAARRALRVLSRTGVLAAGHWAGQP